MKIIDSHIHWYPRGYYDLLQRYNSFPHAEKDGASYFYTAREGQRRSRMADIWFDLDGQYAAMDKTGHSISLIGSAGTRCSELTELPAGFAAEAAQAYNEETSAMQRASNGRFWGTAILPLQDVETSIKMMNEAVGPLELRGVNLPALVAGQAIDSPALEPFYLRAAELGVPLILHAADGIFGLSPNENENLVQFSIGRIFESSVAALRLVISGVMDRHPGLKIVHLHVGGILPYLSGRLDKNARRPGLGLPSTYVRRMYTDTVAPHLHTLRLGLEFYGLDHLMYGSDYPCWKVEEALAVAEALGLGEDDADRLFRRNAADLFRIPL